MQQLLLRGSDKIATFFSSDAHARVEGRSECRQNSWIAMSRGDGDQMNHEDGAKPTGSKYKTLALTHLRHELRLNFR